MGTESIGQGTLRTADGRVLPLERTDVRARIGGPVATVEVRQLFRNTTTEPIEAIYGFPLPHEASVHRMEFRIADRVVRSVVKTKEDARRTYENAKSEGRAATLLEQDQPSLFTLSVANVPPGATIEVRLEYQDALGFDDGQWRFVFPLVAPERYVETPDAPSTSGARVVGSAQAGSPASTTTTGPSAVAAVARPPRLPSGTRADAVSLEVEVRSDAAIEALRCASHRVDIERLDDGAHRVKLHPDGVANRDFVLSYRASEAGVRPHAWFARENGQTGTFMLVLAPPGGDVAKTQPQGGGNMKALACGNCGGIVTDLSSLKEIPGLGSVVRCTFCGALLAPSTEPPFTRATRLRDVAILVDRSASMRGSITQSRRAVRALLDALAPGDGVQVIAFDHDRVAFDGDGSRFVALAPEVVSRIDSFLGDLAPRGGSELEAALSYVAKLPVREGRTRAVVLVTDAAVGNEGRLLRRAPEILGVERRLFVLGVGPAVDRRLVEKLARTCGGASDTLLPNEDVEPVLARFARRVRDGGPVLTGVSIDWEAGRARDIQPAVVPDLYGGEPVRLVGRYDDAGACRLVITAASADGKPFRQEVTIDFPEVSEQVPGLDRVWAKRKVGALLDRAAKDPSSAARVKTEVTDLALLHALVTPYTSLVAEDSQVVAERPAKRVDVAAPSPDGATDRGDVTPSRLDVPASRTASERRTVLAEDALADHAEGVGPSTGAPPRPGGAYGGGPASRGSSAPVAAPAPIASPPSPPPMRASGPMAPRSAPASTLTGGYTPPSVVPAPAGAIAPHASAPAPEPIDRAMSAPPSALGTRGRIAGAAAPGGAKGSGGGVLGTLKKVFGIGDDATEEELDADAASFDEPTPIAPAGYAGDYDRDVTESPRPASATAPASRHQPTTKRPPAADTSSFAEPPGSEPYEAAELEWLASRHRGALDLVFLVDETGSMGGYIAQVQSRLLELVAALRASPLCRSMRLGLVSYRDHAPQDHTYASKVVALTEDLDAIERAVRGLVASGGGDGPESVTDGLVDIVRLAWRPNAARAVAWFGDAPPHGVSPNGDAWPEGCPCGHHWYTQAESCREMGIAVYAVGCLPNLRSYPGGEDVYRTVASTSRGIYLPLSESRMLVPLIAGAAVTELDKQRLDEHVADVIAANESDLRKTDETERVRWVTDVLRGRGVRPREMAYDPSRSGPAPMKYRDVRASDVEGSFDRLRASGRMSF